MDHHQRRHYSQRALAASTCSAISDESGMASTWVTPAATGNAVITATLAPGVYSPAQSVGSTLSATSTSLDIGVTPPTLWIAAGATLSVPLTARLVSLGAPQSGKQVNFFIDQGSGSLSSTSAVTNTSGYATVTLTVTNFTVGMQLSACAGPGNNPCQNISVNAVAAAAMNLQAVAGAGQVVTGAAFQPLTVRVTDSSTPPESCAWSERAVSIYLVAACGKRSDPDPGRSYGHATGPARLPQREPEYCAEQRQRLRQFHALGGIIYQPSGTRDSNLSRNHGCAAGRDGSSSGADER